MAITTGTNGANTLTGTNAADRLFGLGGNDRLLGLNGNDTLDGGLGDDILTGGAGNDLYLVDSPDDRIVETASGGTDTVIASVSYSLARLAHVETLLLDSDGDIDGSGNTLHNLIVGTPGDNLLDGRGGNDTLDGLEGDDDMRGGSGADLLVGGDDDDRLAGGSGNDALDAGEGTDRLLGGSGNDRLLWDAIDERADGGSGVDTLELTGFGETLDLTGDAGARVRNVEIVDLTGLGNNSLVVSAGAVQALSTTTNTLRVDGIAGDAVNGGDGWQFDGVKEQGGQTYLTFNQGSAVLEVDIDVGGDLEAAIDLSSLDGTTGFRLNGALTNDSSGFSVASAGDVNADGYADLIIGAPISGIGRGVTYVVFGASAFASSMSLEGLNGTTGFFLEPGDAVQSGLSVASAGDVNGDGYADIVIGAIAGRSYVVFGGETADPLVELDALDGADGFLLDGINSDPVGYTVASAGDVNGDGYSDILVGAPSADGYAGRSYVVFGRSSFTASVDLTALDGTTGFQLTGIDANDLSGRSVAFAGDVNGDGLADIVIGAPEADAIPVQVGESYVVFGRESFSSSLDLGALDGSDGFRLDGDALSGGGRSGWSVASAGDVNGDGYADLVIGGRYSSASHVVFGSSTFASSISLSALDGTNGFRLDGTGTDQAGRSVASAGDVNGDGYADLVIGAPTANTGGGVAGAGYVIFGGALFESSLSLTALAGTDGFRLDGIDGSDGSGSSVASAGDVNGDGFDDLIIGAPGADPSGTSSAGESYVVYGRDFTGEVTHTGTAAADTLIGGSGADNLLGGAGDDKITGGGNADRLAGGSGNDTLSGSGGADRLLGGDGEDSFVFSSAPAADEILDFTSSEDHIVLDRSVFTAFVAAGTVIAASVQVAASGAITATSGDGDDFLKYATDTGELYYDANGSGAGGLLLIATVSSGGMTGQSPAVFQFHPVTDIIIID
jgi:Ca2+-binding RTX toxin-like protein